MPMLIGSPKAETNEGILGDVCRRLKRLAVFRWMSPDGKRVISWMKSRRRMPLGRGDVYCSVVAWRVPVAVALGCGCCFHGSCSHRPWPLKTDCRGRFYLSSHVRFRV